MSGEPRQLDDPKTVTEGAVSIHLEPSGRDRGPGRKSDVFYNPSMVQNRDLSVLLLKVMLSAGLLPGRDSIDILDGLCGSGIRALRFAKEVGDGGGRVRYFGCDREVGAVEHARKAASENGVDVAFERGDLAGYLSGRRFSYIDVDPFGSPVQFIPQALSSLLSGGVLAVTATDTAALTGSARKAALRRYGVHHRKTDHMHEASCRVLLGYIVRTAASIDRSVHPLFFYSSDHFVRGYARVFKSSRKADQCMEGIGYLLDRPPDGPKVVGLSDLMKGTSDRAEAIGPLWTGPLEDPPILGDCIDQASRDSPFTSNLAARAGIISMLERGLKEHQLPPGGFDMNSLASHFKTSPPRIETVITMLSERGFKASRSRFSNTLIKTDAPLSELLPFFKGNGEEGI